MREELAALAHEQWSGWVKYMFKCMTHNDDGTSTVPEWACQRWVRQMYTPYADLPENEKESDRTEADKVLAIIGKDRV